MKYAVSSILLSLIVICAAVWVNVSIANDYLKADGNRLFKLKSERVLNFEGLFKYSWH